MGTLTKKVRPKKQVKKKKKKKLSQRKDEAEANLLALPKENLEILEKSLREKMLQLADRIARKGLESEDIAEMAVAITACARYKQAKTQDTMAIVNMIATANPAKLRVIEGVLKKQVLLDNIKKGKPTLSEMYKLPDLKNKKK